MIEVLFFAWPVLILPQIIVSLQTVRISGTQLLQTKGNFNEPSRTIFIIVLMTLVHAIGTAQVNFVPVDDRVYVFLEK